MTAVLANIMGPDLLIVVGLVVLLFGGSQVPKLARGIGQAKKEFEKASVEEDKPEEAKPAAQAPPAEKRSEPAPAAEQAPAPEVKPTPPADPSQN